MVGSAVGSGVAPSQATNNRTANRAMVKSLVFNLSSSVSDVLRATRVAALQMEQAYHQTDETASIVNAALTILARTGFDRGNETSIQWNTYQNTVFQARSTTFPQVRFVNRPTDLSFAFPSSPCYNRLLQRSPCLKPLNTLRYPPLSKARQPQGIPQLRKDCPK